MRCMSSIGERIRTLRKKKGLNQTQLGGECGVDQSMISDYEKNLAVFNAAILVKMALALDTTMDAIMLGEPNQDEANLLAWFRSCGPNERAALLTTAKAMASTSAAVPVAIEKPEPRKRAVNE